jgi:hypothetical protein
VAIVIAIAVSIAVVIAVAIAVNLFKNSPTVFDSEIAVFV